MVASFTDHRSAPILETSGVLIPFDPAIITGPIYSAIIENRFEQEEASELATIVEPGDRVLEIGAGIGFISTLLDRLPDVAHVVAVEANPDLLPFMETLHSLNRVTKVKRKNRVLTNDPCSAKTFYLREDFWMGSLSAEPNAYRATVNVQTESLDALISKEEISLIVCDIEGAEAFLFEDADLTPVDRVYLELHDHITGLKGIRRLFAAMDAKGFAYDPRHSSNAIVLFRRVMENEVLRPYES